MFVFRLMRVVAHVRLRSLVSFKFRGGSAWIQVRSLMGYGSRLVQWLAVVYVTLLVLIMSGRVLVIVVVLLFGISLSEGLKF